MSLFPRFTQEFAPMFRLFDEYDRQAFRDVDRQFQSIRSFTPKFDVKETKEAYELHGELPGIEQKNVREEGQRPTAIEAGEDQKKIEPHQPRVEDEAAESANKDTQVAKQSEQQLAKGESKHRYWVSERSVGSFHRSFAFPARVDQDAVKASLKNGILSITVPKATAPQSRKVNIE
ncbi:HSP20-like chaperone [Boeremia exigua]|uniref:HSP20-like chaperone n=1 Tax=Boeremia exigua TaxID=749465 RepID=UPI001E8CE99C|nr:HSP20-like chaperone [Boeremia exigua]KAH6612069.1 HSP20-like chaperone [Boeremia exigua]